VVRLQVQHALIAHLKHPRLQLINVSDSCAASYAKEHDAASEAAAGMAKFLTSWCALF
jgi:hypothetical protein